MTPKPSRLYLVRTAASNVVPMRSAEPALREHAWRDLVHRLQRNPRKDKPA